MQFEMLCTQQRCLGRSIHAIERRIVEHQRDALRRGQTGRTGAAVVQPATNDGASPRPATVARSGEFGDDFRRIVNLRDNQNIFQPRDELGLVGGLRRQRHHRTFAANLHAERKARDRAAATLIGPSGFCLARAPTRRISRRRGRRHRTRTRSTPRLRRGPEQALQKRARGGGEVQWEM